MLDTYLSSSQQTSSENLEILQSIRAAQASMSGRNPTVSKGANFAPLLTRGLLPSTLIQNCIFSNETAKVFSAAVSAKKNLQIGASNSDCKTGLFQLFFANAV